MSIYDKLPWLKDIDPFDYELNESQINEIKYYYASEKGQKELDDFKKESQKYFEESQLSRISNGVRFEGCHQRFK